MRSLDWLGSLKTLDRGLATYRQDLLGIQEVLSGRGVTEPHEGLYVPFYGKEIRVIN